MPILTSSLKLWVILIDLKPRGYLNVWKLLKSILFLLKSKILKLDEGNFVFDDYSNLIPLWLCKEMKDESILTKTILNKTFLD